VVLAEKPSGELPKVCDLRDHRINLLLAQLLVINILGVVARVEYVETLTVVLVGSEYEVNPAMQLGRDDVPKSQNVYDSKAARILVTKSLAPLAPGW
jgi:hypothetical protein